MLTEETVIDQITVTEDGHVLVREATIIKRDGIEISRTFHRTSHKPGADVSIAAEKVQAITALVWTQEVVAQFQAKQSPT